MSGNRRQSKRRRAIPSSDKKNSAPPAKKKASRAEENQEKVLVPADDLAQLKARIEALESRKEALESRNEQLELEKKMRSFVTLRNVPKPFRLLRRSGPYSHHVNSQYLPADATEVEFSLQYPDDSVLEKMNSGSQLLQRFVNQEPSDNKLQYFRLPYYSEADVCSFVRNAVDDAIRILEVEGTIEPCMFRTTFERSLFGCRPNIMVVRDETGMGYLAFEVKQPIPPQGEKTTLVADPKVLGQAFDHAMAMDAFWQGTSIVIITSFEESYMCSLNESDFEQAMESKEAGKTEPTNGGEMGESNAEDSPKQTQLQSLPPELNQKQLQTQSPSDSSETSKLQDGTGESQSVFRLLRDSRKLYRSKKYESHQLVWLVYTALGIALKKHQKTVKTIDQLRPNLTYIFPKCLKVIEGDIGYAWGEARCQVGLKIQHQVNSRRVVQKRRHGSYYYIIGSLGNGATSNVYQALDSSGKQVALKMYVKNYLPDEMMANEEFPVIAKAATSKEAENLVKIYPFLKNEVKTTEICGKHCVVMPFFEPIKKGERKGQLAKIKTVLERFKEQKLQYEEQDVCWRHVGNYKETEEKVHCILYDLSDLVETTSDSFVDEHCKMFEDRIPENLHQKTAFKATIEATKLGEG
eukprot:scaffold9639_cov84-Cylindrotheca_fusiformis.AAC.1